VAAIPDNNISTSARIAASTDSLSVFFSSFPRFFNSSSTYSVVYPISFSYFSNSNNSSKLKSENTFSPEDNSDKISTTLSTALICFS
jgi:hypothetical protein